MHILGRHATRDFWGQGSNQQKGHTKQFLNRMYLEIMVFIFKNKRNRTGCQDLITVMCNKYYKQVYITEIQ